MRKKLSKKVQIIPLLLAGNLLFSGCDGKKSDTASGDDLHLTSVSAISLQDIFTPADDADDLSATRENISARREEEVILPANISFNHSYVSGIEYGEIIAYDEKGDQMWEVHSDGYEAAQLDQVCEIGLLEDKYYYTEGGTIICLDASSGLQLWKNAEFGGSSVHHVFDTDKDLFVCGYYGPDLFGVDQDGNSITRIENADDDYMWPAQLEIADNQIKITYESSTSGSGGSISVSIDGKATLSPYVSADGSSCNPTESSNSSSSGAVGYSDDELCRMAGDYYERHNDGRPQCVDIDSVDGDLVTLHLYNMYDDHTATFAWYQVNRNTASGTDTLTGDEIDLLD